ncbi:hypothetical protein IWQ60_005103 [Tieghemiomyces parasiticus]|uniref:BZIP domain-containing protein n=1 Tax=Tieghemiomyces parasiticus TaxID=78921 RepID=A0A9W8ACE3_9FUNG|nr:hypothetical protein IWQ60_005103 [Tieghemiomyces parasiticus]
MDANYLNPNLLSYLLDQSAGLNPPAVAATPSYAVPDNGELYRQLLTEMINHPEYNTGSFLLDSSEGSSPLVGSPTLLTPSNPTASFAPSAFNISYGGAMAPTQALPGSVNMFTPSGLPTPTFSTRPALSIDTTTSAGTMAATNVTRPVAGPSPNLTKVAVSNDKPSGDRIPSASLTSSVSSSPTASSPTANSLKRAASALDEDEVVDMKQLSSKERRQIRNKISARNFRARRKEYITTLEGQVSELQDELDEAHDSLEQANHKCRRLQARLDQLALAVDPALLKLAVETADRATALLEQQEKAQRAVADAEELASQQADADNSNSPSLPETAIPAHHRKSSAATLMSLLNLSTLLTHSKTPVILPSSAPIFALPPPTPLGTHTSDNVTSPPPTPFASPVLTAMSTPETLVGDDEILGHLDGRAKAAKLTSSRASFCHTPAFFSTHATATPVNSTSPSLRAKQLPHSQAELESLESTLAHQFHNVLSASLDQVAQLQ